MPRTRVVRFDLRHTIISNDSDDSSDDSSTSSNSSTSSSSDTSHNTSVASVASSINSPPRSPSHISLQFSDSDGDSDANIQIGGNLSPDSTNSDSSNPANISANLNTSSSSNNSSTRSAGGRRVRRLPNISLFASDSDNDSSDAEVPQQAEVNSDASTNSSFDLGSGGAAGSSFGFSPQRSSLGSGSGGSRRDNSSLNISLDDSSDDDHDNDELRNRRDLFEALALIEPSPEQVEEVLEPPPALPPRVVRPRQSRMSAGAHEPRRAEELFNFGDLLSNISGSGRSQRSELSSTSQRVARFFDNLERLNQEEEEDPTEDEEEDDLDTSTTSALGLVEAYRRSQNLRLSMSRVQGAGGQGTTTSSSSGSAPRASSAPVVGPSTITYECSVCLENLDQPASIDLENNGEDGGGDVGLEMDLLVMVGGAGRRGGGRGRGRLSQRNAVSAPSPAGRQRRPAAGSGPVNLTDVVATHCGHLYHQVCLEKWFTEQGRRTCPSCRKNVPKSKCIRLYPNIAQDLGGRGGGQHNENAAPPPAQVQVVVPGSSTGGSGGSGTSSGVSSANEGGGGGGRGGPVCINVGDGDGGDDGGGGNGGDCLKAQCQDLKLMHNTLMNDFNELQERYNDVRENDELKEATIRSLEDDNVQKGNEIERLKRQIQEDAELPSGRSVVAGSSGSAPKRRRR